MEKSKLNKVHSMLGREALESGCPHTTSNSFYHKEPEAQRFHSMADLQVFTEVVGLTVTPNEHVAAQELNHHRHSDDYFLPSASKNLWVSSRVKHLSSEF